MRAYGNFMGHEKEPPSKGGGKSGGKQPPVHSHSKKPRRKVVPGKRGKR